MPDVSAFPDLIERLRRGDPEAAAELVRGFEATVRRIVRFRLVDARLGAVVDSMDICQSVLASFFVRAAVGQYELDSPDQLVKLLATMARNKLAGHARKERTLRRDNRRNSAGLDEDQLLGNDSSPSQRAVTKELLARAELLLTPDEKQLVELRRLGHEWNNIAQQLGENPVALRKRLSRAMDRVTRDLGIDGASHE
jgi:RNA polymerase sigma factor (sigma-70 family)